MVQTCRVVSLQGPGLFLLTYLHLGRTTGSNIFVIRSVARLYNIKHSPWILGSSTGSSAGLWGDAAGITADLFPSARAGRLLPRGRVRGCSQDKLPSRLAAPLSSRAPGRAAPGPCPFFPGPPSAAALALLFPTDRAASGLRAPCRFPGLSLAVRRAVLGRGVGRSQRADSQEQRPPPGLEGAEGQAAAPVVSVLRAVSPGATGTCRRCPPLLRPLPARPRWACLPPAC